MPRRLPSWDEVGSRLGKTIPADVVHVFDTVAIADALPFRPWLPAAWTSLRSFSEHADDRSDGNLPDLVVVGVETEGELDETGLYYCLELEHPKAVGLWTWRRGAAPERVTRNLMTLPEIRDAMADILLGIPREPEYD